MLFCLLLFSVVVGGGGNFRGGGGDDRDRRQAVLCPPMMHQTVVCTIPNCFTNATTTNCMSAINCMLLYATTTTTNCMLFYPELVNKQTYDKNVVCFLLVLAWEGQRRPEHGGSKFASASPPTPLHFEFRHVLLLACAVRVVSSFFVFSFLAFCIYLQTDNACFCSGVLLSALVT